MKLSQKNKGIIFILLAGFFFATMGVGSRMAGDLPVMQKAFFRNFFAAVFAFCMLLKQQHDFRYPVDTLPFLAIRSICGTLGIICNFYALDHLVLSDANILNKFSPFAAIVFSFLFLKEKINLPQLLTLLGAFIGVCLVIQPSFSFQEVYPGLIGFLGGIMAGAAYTAVRYLGKMGLESIKIVFFFSLFSCLVILPFVLLNYAWMSPFQFLMLILCGISAAGGQVCITKAYTYAPAKEISIYDYFQILVAAIYGFVLWGQKPNFISIVGYLIIFIMSFVNWKRANSPTN